MSFRGYDSHYYFYRVYLFPPKIILGLMMRDNFWGKNTIFFRHPEFIITYYVRNILPWPFNLQWNLMQKNNGTQKYLLENITNKYYFMLDMTYELTVSPEVVVVFPHTYTLRGATDAAACSIWLFPRPGSPTTRICGSPLTGIRFCLTTRGKRQKRLNILINNSYGPYTTRAHKRCKE